MKKVFKDLFAWIIGIAFLIIYILNMNALFLSLETHEYTLTMIVCVALMILGLIGYIELDKPRKEY